MLIVYDDGLIILQHIHRSHQKWSVCLACTFVRPSRRFATFSSVSDASKSWRWYTMWRRAAFEATVSSIMAVCATQPRRWRRPMAWRFATSASVSTTRTHSEHTRQRRAFIGDIGDAIVRLSGPHSVAVAAAHRDAIDRGVATIDLIGTFTRSARVNEIVKGDEFREVPTLDAIGNVRLLGASDVVSAIAVKLQSIGLRICFYPSFFF